MYLGSGGLGFDLGRIRRIPEPNYVSQWFKPFVAQLRDIAGLGFLGWAHKASQLGKRRAVFISRYFDGR